MISAVVGYGNAYNPSNQLITLAALQAALDAANDAMDNVSTKKATESLADTARENLFAPLGSLVTRTFNYYTSTGAPDNRIADAKVFHRKMQGKRATPLPVDDPATPADEAANKHSVSQQSYTQKIEHLDGLIDLYEGDVAYAPNENDLKTAELVNVSDQLKAANMASINAATNTVNSLDHRDDVLYNIETGLVARAALVKKYVAAVFGVTSPQYAQVKGLKFRYHER